MSAISETTLRKLNTLNKWLSDVFGEGHDLNHLLSQDGLSETDITHLTISYLTEYIASIIKMIESIIDNQVEEARNTLLIDLVMRRYGLRTGQPENYSVISNSVGVAGERCRLLVDRRLQFYKDPKRKEILTLEMVKLAKQMLYKD
jgi:hypothetical protein